MRQPNTNQIFISGKIKLKSTYCDLKLGTEGRPRRYQLLLSLLKEYFSGASLELKSVF